MDPDLLAHATEFTFLPGGANIDDKEVHFFTVTVARRSNDLWAVLWMTKCWNRKSKSWEHESFPSSRTDKFLRNARFPLDEALEIAFGAPDRLTVMGKSWLDFEEMHARQTANRG